MVKLTRERIALVVFFVLVVTGACLLLSYFATGRSWSVAATAVDDSMGQLESYTALVYNGVAEPDPASSTESDQGTPSSAYAQDEPDPDEETGLGLRLLTLAAEVDGTTDGRIYASDVSELYETRGASALTLDASHDGARYADPVILDAGNKKVGVFSVKERLPRSGFQSIVDGLREDGAESVICITPRPSLVSSYDGVDVVLVTQGKHEYAIENSPDDGTVVTTSPLVGEVGVILLSSNNVPLVKTIGSL